MAQRANPRAAEQREWLTKFLGVRLPTTGGKSAREVLHRLKNLMPGYRAAAAGGPAETQIRDLFATVKALSDGKDYEAACGVLDQIENLVADRSNADARALASWRKAVGRSVSQLEQLRKAVEAVRDPDARAIAGILSGIANRLQVDVGSASAVKELQTYLRDDRNVAAAEADNPFGIVVKLRELLLQALGGMSRAPAS
jgi:hypothetical protein